MGISELTALELGKEIKEKQISVREAVQASLERIHKYEDTVHAYVTLTRRQHWHRRMRSRNRLTMAP